MLSRPHTHCRLCGTELPPPILDLGIQPFANALTDVPPTHHTGIGPRDAALEAAASLQLTECTVCGLGQLTEVVDPSALFRGYKFRAGASAAWRDHVRQLAGQLDEQHDTLARPGVPHRATADASSGTSEHDARRLGRLGRRRVLDIAANDGTLLRAFHERGWECLGVDPAPCGGSPSYDILPEYWNDTTAKHIRDNYPPFDLVVAQNVLGHVDDPVGFLAATRLVLAPEARVIIEVPSYERLKETLAFDTIYHEHCSYWSKAALESLAERSACVIVGCEDIPTHGGSFRFTLQCPAGSSLQQQIDRKTDRIADALMRSTGRILAWGASAKATVSIEYLRARHPHAPLPEAIIDETEEKQGRFMPGSGIPVLAPPHTLGDVGLLWITSWNNADVIMAKARALGYIGQFLVADQAEPRLI